MAFPAFLTTPPPAPQTVVRSKTTKLPAADLNWRLLQRIVSILKASGIHERRHTVLLLLALACAVAQTALQLRGSLWRARIVTALAALDRDAVVRAFAVDVAYEVAAFVAASALVLVRQLLYYHWRTRFTRHVVRRYLSGYVLYSLQRSGSGHVNSDAIDNPDQRLQQDADLFFVSLATLASNTLQAVLGIACVILCCAVLCVSVQLSNECVHPCAGTPFTSLCSKSTFPGPFMSSALPSPSSVPSPIAIPWGLTPR